MVWLSLKHSSLPIPQIVYGQVLQSVAEREKKIFDDPKEKTGREIQAARAAALREKIDALPGSLERESRNARKILGDLRAANGTARQIGPAEKALRSVPRDPAAARTLWTNELRIASSAELPAAHTAVYPGKDEEARDTARRNFIALLFCLMLGTAGLRDLFFVKGEIQLWWGTHPISAGVFGVPASFAVMVLASLLSPKPDEATSSMVDAIRYPGADDKMSTRRDG